MSQLEAASIRRANELGRSPADIPRMDSTLAGLCKHFGTASAAKFRLQVILGFDRLRTRG